MLPPPQQRFAAAVTLHTNYSSDSSSAYLPRCDAFAAVSSSSVGDVGAGADSVRTSRRPCCLLGGVRVTVLGRSNLYMYVRAAVNDGDGSSGVNNDEDSGDEDDCNIGGDGGGGRTATTRTVGMRMTATLVVTAVVGGLRWPCRRRRR